MKIIKFVRSGESISDFELQNKVQQFISSNQTLWQIANHIVVNEFRALIKEKIIKSEDYRFFVEDLEGEIHEFFVDEEGVAQVYYNSQQLNTSALMRIVTKWSSSPTS